MHARTLTTAIAATLLAGVLAGCSGDEPGTGGSDRESTAQDRDQGISPEGLPTAPRLRNSEGAVADIEYDDCATDAGERTVSGTVTNPADQQHSYVITMNWINDTSDVRGRGIAVVHQLEGGESADWKLTADVAGGATQCVPNVLRGGAIGKRSG